MRPSAAGALLFSFLLASSSPAASGAASCGALSFSGPWTVHSGAGWFRTADVDGDGRVDVIASLKDGYGWLRGLDGGTFEPPRSIPLRPFASVGALGDFDGDGSMDLVISRSSSVSVALNDGHGRFAEGPDQGPIPTSGFFAGSWYLAADADGDGRLDLMTNGRDADGAYEALLLRGDGRGSFTVVVARRYTAAEINPGVAAVADLDGDGLPDLLVASAEHRGARLFMVRGDGSGRFDGPSTTVGRGTRVVVADMDRDGRVDLVTAQSHFWLGPEAKVTVYRGTASGFVESGVFSAGEVRYASDLFSVADLDMDGFPDVVAWAGTAGSFAVLGDGAGGFASRIRIGEAEDATPADVTGDGRPDLLSVSYTGDLRLRVNTCGAGIAETTLFLPAFVSGAGANGAEYTTEMAIANRGAATAVIETSYRTGSTSNRAGAALEGTRQLHLPSTIDDQPYGPSYQRLGLPFGGPPSGSSLRLHGIGLSGPSDLVGLVRVVSRVGGAPERGGVAFPLPRYEETFAGTAVVGWLLETASDRSNLALVNVEESGDVTLRVTVVSTDPAHPGSTALHEVTLGPGVFKQLDRVLTLSGLGATSGFARIERIAGSGRFYAYGVVNDNGTSDGSFIPALAAGMLTGETTLVVPAVVEAGSFTTEVIVTNTSATTKKVRLEYVADAIATADHAARLTLDVAPGQGVDLDRFVDALRTLGAPGVGPTGSIFSGALFVTAEGGGAEGLDGLYVGARTSSAAARGRYGVFTQAVPLSKAATSVAWLHGLKQDGVDRTNVALVNAGAEADVFRIEVFDGTTGLLAATVSDVRVEARGWKQLGRILAEKAPGVTNAYAKVTRVSGASPFLAYAVINDGEGPGLGTGDGSYVPMSIP